MTPEDDILEVLVRIFRDNGFDRVEIRGGL